MAICRICKNKIDTKKSLENVEWIMPSRNYYYHVKCYNDWKNSKDDVNTQGDNDMWYASLLDLLSKELRINVDYAKVASQWKNFTKKPNMTAKGIYFAVRYFYEIQHGDVEKSAGGIGIVPHIYAESANYWINRDKREHGICEKIEQQLRLKQAQTVVLVQKHAPKTIEYKTDWSKLEEEDEC